MGETECLIYRHCVKNYRKTRRRINEKTRFFLKYPEKTATKTYFAC
jgi:hypothetical protein